MALASACGGGSELASLELDVPTMNEAEIDTLVQAVENRLDALGISDAEVVRSNASVEIRVPVEDEALVRSTVASEPVNVEVRPVLSTLGLVLTAEDRIRAEARVDEFRAALGLPAGVTAQQVADSEQAARSSAGTGGPTSDE